MAVALCGLLAVAVFMAIVFGLLFHSIVLAEDYRVGRGREVWRRDSEVTRGAKGPRVSTVEAGLMFLFGNERSPGAIERYERFSKSASQPASTRPADFQSQAAHARA